MHKVIRVGFSLYILAEGDSIALQGNGQDTPYEIRIHHSGSTAPTYLQLRENTVDVEKYNARVFAEEAFEMIVGFMRNSTVKMLNMSEYLQ